VVVDIGSLVEQKLVDWVFRGGKLDAAVRVPGELTCTACELRVPGFIEGADYDATTGLFVGGKFVRGS
jgi:hypothetical protein